MADWYEPIKDDFEYNLYKLCTDFREQKLRADLNGWFSNDNNKPIETLVLMHKFGYEVEKEKLYTVEIPNPNRADVSLVLGLYNDGKVAIFAAFTDSWKYEKQYKLRNQARFRMGMAICERGRRMIKKYIKTTPVEAIQVTEDNHEETKEFAFLQRIVFCYGPIRHSIDTLEGKMRFSDGDYLIKNQTGECYVCKKEIFEETYKLLED